MAKYKQNIIPIVQTPEKWKNLSQKELRRKVFDYIKENFANRGTVKNNCLGINVQITVHASRKTAYGEAMYLKKAAVIIALPEIIQNAVYNNWGDRKDSDGENIIGFLNFKCKCIIDNKTEHLRLAIRVQNDGKFYYNVEVNKTS